MIIHHDPRDGVALAAFKSEWWPASRRNSGRLQIGTPGRLRRNTHREAPKAFLGSLGQPLACLLRAATATIIANKVILATSTRSYELVRLGLLSSMCHVLRSPVSAIPDTNPTP